MVHGAGFGSTPKTLLGPSLRSYTAIGLTREFLAQNVFPYYKGVR